MGLELRLPGYQREYFSLHRKVIPPLFIGAAVYLKRYQYGRTKCRQATNRVGAAALEMALVAPIILLISFASIEFSRALMIKQALTNAAREGARTASLITTKNVADVEDRIEFFLRRCITVESSEILSITVTPNNLENVDSGNTITTRVSVNLSDVSWLPPAWTGASELAGTATMRRE